MKVVSWRLGGAIAGIWFGISSPLWADSVLIGELESLRNSLPSSDPSRQTLTLRLADTIFDEIGEITRKPELTEAEQRSVLSYRKRSIALYQESLNGGAGVYGAVTGRLRLKVQFQVARLSAELGLQSEALALWKVLLEQQELPDLRREASLRLAEHAESLQDYVAAERYFTQAIALCAGGDVCSYSHYRRAWSMKNQDRYPAAIEELQQALFDSKGQVREESLRDLILFLSAEPNVDGRRALDVVEPLSTRLSRSSLLSDLGAAFFSAGNRVAGVRVLSLVESRTPTIQTEIKLLEELYGLRQLDRFREMLAKAQAAAAALSAGVEEDSTRETSKILRRLTVQLDGERASRPEFSADFRDGVSLYLALFPRSPERMNMIDGWLASQPDAAKKITQLRAWVEDPKLALSAEEKIKLYETRAAVAQSQKDYPGVVETTTWLLSLSQDPAKQRDYTYAKAHALYDQKDYAGSLPIFKELAQFRLPLPSHAIESQHLALDVLGLQKNFRDVVAQAGLWIEGARGKSLSASVQGELAAISKIAENAEFELAVSLGSTPEALATFQRLCLAGRLTPKSCDNAKVLAVRGHNQTALLAVLKAQDSRAELAAEYEAAGYFIDAAEILAQGLKPGQSAVADYLRVATLFELGGRASDRDRVLGSLMASLRGKKSIAAQEELLFLTLADAGQLTAPALALPWSQQNRERIADSLEQRGLGNRESQKLVAAAERSTGPSWDAQSLKEVQRLDSLQRKIGFYGRGGERKFEARLAALKKFVGYADRRLAGAGSALRVEIAQTLARAHHDLSQEIVSSPMPERLNAEQQEQVRQAIAKMAEPFEAKSKEYEVLAVAQASKGEAAPVLTQAAAPAPVDPSIFQKALGALHENPTDAAALADLKNYYLSRKQSRLASYFQGRISQVEKGVSQ